VLEIAILFTLLLCVGAAWGVARYKSEPHHHDQQPPDRSLATNQLATCVPERFVVVDLETTGLHADRHEIIEIGAIKIALSNEVHPFFQALIVPKKRISSKITALTGLDRTTLVREGSPIEEILPQFLEFCEDLPLVAFNAEFDRAFLESACIRCGHLPPAGSWICALELSRRAWPGRSSYRLSALSSDAGYDMDDEHRAIGDCKRAMKIFLTAAVELRGRGQSAIQLS